MTKHTTLPQLLLGMDEGIKTFFIFLPAASPKAAPFLTFFNGDKPIQPR